MHTLVLVKDSCEVLSFGLGANGQLGKNNTSNSLQPDPVQGDYWTAPVISEAAATGTLLNASLAGGGGGGGGRVLKGIYAGGDQSFATIVVHAQEAMVSVEIYASALVRFRSTSNWSISSVHLHMYVHIHVLTV